MSVFEEACADRYAPARTAADQGRPVAGYLCTYAPVELLHAGGYLPVRIFGHVDGDTRLADSHLQVVACSFVRSAFNRALAGDLEFLSAMVFSHTCDTLQNLAGIWRQNVPDYTHLVVSTPVAMDTDTAQSFLTGELGKARAVLAKATGTISDEALDASIRLYDEHRAAMQRLFDLRRTRPGVISSRDQLAVVLAAFFMPVEDHLPALERLLEAAEPIKPEEDSSLPRVVVVGSVCASEDYLAVLEDSGCVVVDDELCTGTRAFAIEPCSDGPPLERLARMYLSRVPCASKYSSRFDIGRHVLEKAQRAGADGVIFLLTKCCDPWAFDYPHMRDALEGAGIPSMFVEIEQHMLPGEQLRTRFSAFAEMLRAGGA